MAHRRNHVHVVTAADGSATAYSDWLSGKLRAIHYRKIDFADGVDFTITAEASGETLWAESNVNDAKSCMPRGATHSAAGVAALYAAGGAAVNDLIALHRDRIKIVITQGGNAKAGEFIIIIED